MIGEIESEGIVHIPELCIAAAIILADNGVEKLNARPAIGRESRTAARTLAAVSAVKIAQPARR